MPSSKQPIVTMSLVLLIFMFNKMSLISTSAHHAHSLVINYPQHQPLEGGGILQVLKDSFSRTARMCLCACTRLRIEFVLFPILLDFITKIMFLYFLYSVIDTYNHYKVKSFCPPLNSLNYTVVVW